jgi:excisionase family DNA binding protein
MNPHPTAMVAPNKSGAATAGINDTSRLHPDDVAAIAEAVVRVIMRATALPTSPWMTASEAAAYLRCPVSRVRKLTMCGDIPHEHDGRRVLYHRDRLDNFIRDGGAVSP